MKIVITLCVFLLWSYGFSASYAAQTSVDGYWEGVGRVPGDEFRFAFTFRTEAQGIKGSIDILDSGLLAWPLANISVKGSRVHFELPSGGGSIPFDGEVSGSRISGTFRFGPASIPFVLSRAVPKPPPYKQEEVRFQNGNVTLAGTLLIPSNKGPHPAVVFLHGAFPDNRDVWRFYADHLARHGIAALIYDNRGAGASTGYSRAGFDELAADALAGLRLLKARKDINPKQIGLWAKSQGGWIAPLAASRSKDVGFLMLMSAPGVTIAKNNLYESEVELRGRNFTEGEIKHALAFKRSAEEMMRVGAPDDEIEALRRRAEGEKWFPHVGVMPKGHWYRQWFPLVAGYDPVPVWERVACPVLLIYGELDKDVSVEESRVRIEEALKRGRNKDYTVSVFSKADHSILVASEQGRPRLATGLLGTITGWLQERISVKK